MNKPNRTSDKAYCRRNNTPPNKHEYLEVKINGRNSVAMTREQVQDLKRRKPGLKIEVM